MDNIENKITVTELKMELNIECINLKDLGYRLKELTENLECCPCNDLLWNELMHLKKIESKIFEIVDDMESYKHMAEI